MNLKLQIRCIYLFFKFDLIPPYQRSIYILQCNCKDDIGEEGRQNKQEFPRRVHVCVLVCFCPHHPTPLHTPPPPPPFCQSLCC